MTTDRFYEVLVVDDSQPEQKELCHLLEEDGFHAVGCHLASEGLEQVRRRRFGAAIVDLRLPDMGGTELLQLIRDADPQVPVIIHTGAASIDSVKEALNLGAFAYVEKFSDPEELLRQVHRACRVQTGRYAADLEEAVRRRTEELARSNRDLENFASIVAHDLRSPLLTISGYCHLVQEQCQGKIDASVDHYLDQIVEGVVRMNGLIDDLLRYARIARPAEPCQIVDLNRVVAEAMANLGAAIRESGAQIEVGPMPSVVGIRTQLVQAFQNLLANAMKFRRDVPPKIRVGALREANAWQFAIEDNGMGIQPEHFRRIFQVFYRLHGQALPGTGIGLAICKRVVELHGGRIWLTSRVGQGTTFFFTIADRPGFTGSETKSRTGGPVADAPTSGVAS